MPVEPQLRCLGNADHRVIHGDALLALREICPGSVDLIFADPPYNIGKRFGDFVDRWESDEAYLAWCVDWLDACVAALKPSGTMYVMTSTQAMPLLDLYLRKRLTVLSRIMWHYDSSGVQARRKFGSMYEPILHCVKRPDRYTFNHDSIKVEARTGAVRKLIDYRKPVPTVYSSEKVPGNVWYFPRVRYRMPEYEDHPTQKPEALLERIILASSNPGEVVLDPFAGSFTTPAVAKRLCRRTIAIEQHEPYIEIGLRRLGLAEELDGRSLRRPAKAFGRTPKSDGSQRLFGD